MKQRPLYAGKTPLHAGAAKVKGGTVLMDGETMHKISNVDRMAPFFMSLVSDTDLWMFISSNGALTAGRKNPDHAIFPYYTDDRIHDSADQTGSKTILRVDSGSKTCLWEPLSVRQAGLYKIERNLYKNVAGNKLVFEEINSDLSLAFRTAWLMSDRFGFIKHSVLANLGRKAVAVEMLDGVQNLVPPGITRRFQLEYSTLADGYKKCELDQATGLGLFTLSSVPTDRAEPSEALAAVTAWCAGLDGSKFLLSSGRLDAFRTGAPVKSETDLHGRRGAYFAVSRISLPALSGREWFFALDTDQDAAAVAGLRSLLNSRRDLRNLIFEDVAGGTENLKRIVAGVDGLEATADELSDSRHFSNALFNAMRGGVPDNGVTISKKDFEAFVVNADHSAAAGRKDFFNGLPDEFPHSDLAKAAAGADDPGLERLALEYLPLTFGRRHGDPSRPWNLFSIEIRDAAGRRILNYQGNWRDLFQNWEALAPSFPSFIEGMIAKFVNASTADGYNPYRVTREGFEWEKHDPHDPWSYIGYWGDHQIVYLWKLLEMSGRFHPGRLGDLLTKDVFAYADVPYRIRPYDDLLRDPRNTIDFDAGRDLAVEKRVRDKGADGRFVHGRDGRVLRVNLAEKLLVPILAKLANFIPEAGVWMNTQRPEWNDANNALVGSGASVVTLCHLAGHLSFCRSLAAAAPERDIPLSEEVAGWFASTAEALERHRPMLDGPVSDADRRTLLDGLGRPADGYRKKLYAEGLSERRTRVPASVIAAFMNLAGSYVEHSIRSNRRPDGLYHAYNLVKVEADGSISIRRLYEMLEGQAAVLGSGLLSADESLALLDTLRASALYRKDQSSYILYPDRRLPRFLEKNNLPAGAVEGSALLRRMAETDDRRIVVRDPGGRLHFNAAFRNAGLLKQALDGISEPGLAGLAAREAPAILDLYERMFDHQSFTGRSGTFYKYEGLGCIYWHMVSKLCLAAQEAFFRAGEQGAAADVRKRLRRHYEAIRDGLGVHKPPDRYGAFPTDPYSHTPGFAGVQQPGMTGQVKEDLLSRFGELGAAVENGILRFRPGLLDGAAFLKSPRLFRYFHLGGGPGVIDLPKGSLAFTICQVPVVVRLSRDEKITVTRQSGETLEHDGLALDRGTSESIFERRGAVRRLDVFLHAAGGGRPETRSH
jgi:hypothetical protein